MGTILLIILILLLIGALPAWPYSSGWGYYPSGGLGLILLIVVILALTAECRCRFVWSDRDVAAGALRENDGALVRFLLDGPVDLGAEVERPVDHAPTRHPIPLPARLVF